MRTPLSLLDDIRIASPCAAEWADMVGDRRARHCGDCDKTVYDISHLTAHEAAALIREKEGEACVRLYRRADGKVLTADCPVGWRQKLEQVRAGLKNTMRGFILSVLISLLLGLLFIMGFWKKQEEKFNFVGKGKVGGRPRCVFPELNRGRLHMPREEARELHMPREEE